MTHPQGPRDTHATRNATPTATTNPATVRNASTRLAYRSAGDSSTTARPYFARIIAHPAFPSATPRNTAPTAPHPHDGTHSTPLSAVLRFPHLGLSRG